MKVTDRTRPDPRLELSGEALLDARSYQSLPPLPSASNHASDKSHGLPNADGHKPGNGHGYGHDDGHDNGRGHDIGRGHGHDDDHNDSPG